MSNMTNPEYLDAYDSGRRDGRESLAQELRETLRVRGYWSPAKGAPVSDLITAVAKALDGDSESTGREGSSTRKGDGAASSEAGVTATSRPGDSTSADRRIPCPQCGERERYSASYDKQGAHWTCFRCGYRAEGSQSTDTNTRST